MPARVSKLVSPTWAPQIARAPEARNASTYDLLGTAGFGSSPNSDKTGATGAQTFDVEDLATAFMRLQDGGTTVGQVTRRELAAGVNFLAFPDLPSNRQAAELLRTVQKRQRLLGSAWLTAAGHKRPDTPAGLPLEEAQHQAAELDQQARRLAEPVSFRLSVERA